MGWWGVNKVRFIILDVKEFRFMRPNITTILDEAGRIFDLSDVGRENNDVSDNDTDLDEGFADRYRNSEFVERVFLTHGGGQSILSVIYGIVCCRVSICVAETLTPF